MFYIVGLGNPGDEYKGSRHNVGREIVDGLCKGDDWAFSDNAQALYCHEKIGKHKVELIKPETYMNKSGKTVKYVFQKHKPNPENLIVVQDDIDLPLGIIKVVKDRGSGGHKGIKSIKKAIGTNDFVRVRFGISKTTPKGIVKKPTTEEAVRKFVLGKFSSTEQKTYKQTAKRAVESIKTIIEDGLITAQNKFN